MEPPDDRAERRDESTRPPRQRGSGPSRQRGESGTASGGSGRAPQESRRRRGGEQRYAGFGDDVERAFCIRTEHVLPETFPVASHVGTATVPQTVVARREGAVLLCTFSHFGEHVWPDGEVVSEVSDTPN